MPKFCIKCGGTIRENSKTDEDKFVMVITKRGRQIVEFACFHLKCWKQHFRDVGISNKRK